MRFGDAEIGEHQGGGFGLHRAAAIGMQGELARRDIMLDDGVVEQRLEQCRAFRVRNMPSDNPAAENINDDIEIEAGNGTGGKGGGMFMWLRLFPWHSIIGLSLVAALRWDALRKSLKSSNRRGIVKNLEKGVQAGLTDGLVALLVSHVRLHVLNRGKSIKNGQTGMRRLIFEEVAA